MAFKRNNPGCQDKKCCKCWPESCKRPTAVSVPLFAGYSGTGGEVDQCCNHPYGTYVVGSSGGGYTYNPQWIYDPSTMKVWPYQKPEYYATLAFTQIDNPCGYTWRANCAYLLDCTGDPFSGYTYSTSACASPIDRLNTMLAYCAASAVGPKVQTLYHGALSTAGLADQFATFVHIELNRRNWKVYGVIFRAHEVLKFDPTTVSVSRIMCGIQVDEYVGDASSTCASYPSELLYVRSRYRWMADRTTSSTLSTSKTYTDSFSGFTGVFCDPLDKLYLTWA